MKIRAADAKKRFPELLIDSVGDLEAVVENILPPQQAGASSMVFVVDDKFLDSEMSSPAPVLVVGTKAKAAVEKAVGAGRCVLFSKNVKLAMALVKTECFAKEIPLQARGTIHPTAILDPSAKIGKNV